jgi:hypothetical protein
LGIALNIFDFVGTEKPPSPLTGKLALSYNEASRREFFPEAEEEHVKEAVE